MQIFATLVVAATAVLAQQIGSEEGPSVSNGPVALSNPNVNNGWQAQNSLINSGTDGGNVFENLSGNTFSKSLSNFAMSDNNFINPSQTKVSGNSGSTTNGEGNMIGDFFAGAVSGLHRRDAVFNNYGYAHARGGYERPVVYDRPVVYERPVVYSRPEVYVRPVVYSQPQPQVYARPQQSYGHPAAYGYPVDQSIHNHQDASIVQNQNRA
ncbi:hypothetical protein IWW37_003861 [Coemansia sp. RSA 2050]|nr:hypothetical protein IWW37_003861 [Coemansia sp. RSA 2050]KAJ2733281.1 hypothetical protein IW152_003200 [Coemansia sp. BCRC 34962]